MWGCREGGPGRPERQVYCRDAAGAPTASHARQRAQPEELQAGLEDEQRPGAEQEAAGLHRGVIHDHLVGDVEGAEFPGQLEEIRAQEMGSQLRGGEVEHSGEAGELAGEGELLGRFGRGRARRGGGGGGFEPGLAEDRVDAGHRVEEVRRGVALEGEDLLPREDVVAASVLREVGVADGADADGIGDVAALGLGEVGRLLGDEGEGAFLGLGEEGLQLDGVAGAGLDGLAVLAEDRTERDVLEARQPATGVGEPFPGGEPELLEVIRLAGVGQDGDRIGPEVLGAVEHRREVGRGVVGGAVGFADDERLGLEPRVLGMKDDERALRLDGEAGGGELRVNLRDLVVVEALAELVVEVDAELAVDGGEGAGAERVDAIPEGAVLGVAGLQQHEFGADGIEDGGVGLGGGIGGLVDALEFLERIGGEGGVVAEVLIAPDELAELRAPVADVIVADDLGAAEGEQAADGLADDHAADVADVELLGGVGRAEVDDVALALVKRGGAGLQVLRGVVGAEPGEEGGGLEAEVDEARAGDADLEDLAQAGGQGGDDLVGDGPGVELAGLGVAQHPVGLEVAVPRIGRAQLRRERIGFQPGGLGGGLHGSLEVRGNVERNVHPASQRFAAATAQAWSEAARNGPKARCRPPPDWGVLARQIQGMMFNRKLFRPAAMPQLFTINSHEQQTHHTRPPIHQAHF